MPYPAETRVPSSSTDDSGDVVDVIARGGKDYFGRIVAVISELVSEGEKIEAWGNGKTISDILTEYELTGYVKLGVKSQFQQISVEELSKHFKIVGLSPYLAVTSSGLCGALDFEEAILTADEIIQAKDVGITHVERK